MVYGLVRVTPPSLEPVTLEEAKAHLRIDGNDEDAYVSSLIAAARAHIEHLTDRALLTQTFRLSLDRWPDAGRAVELPRAPLQSVTSLEIADLAGGFAGVDPHSYEVDTATGFGRIFRKTTASWPQAGACLGAIAINFVAGYGDLRSDAPPELRHAVLLLLAHWFERREGAMAEAVLELPLGIGALLQAYRKVRL